MANGWPTESSIAISRRCSDSWSLIKRSSILWRWSPRSIGIGFWTACGVLSCGKCSNGEEFPPFGIRLNRRSMIYELDPQFNLHEWEAGVQEGRKREPLDELLELCQAEPCARPTAVKKLMEMGFSRATAYRALKEAESEKLLTISTSGLLQVEAPLETEEQRMAG